jgi:hypothetical protein
MGDVLKMAPNMEQKEAQAKAILDRINAAVKPEELTRDEFALVEDIVAGRAVTAGRLAMLQEIERKYVKERK